MPSMPRYLGRMVLGKLINKGYSVPAVVRYLRRTTGGWHYQTMLTDIREAKGISQFGKAVKSLAPNVIAPKRIMVETDLMAARKYRVFGTAKYVNPDTGHTKYKTVSFYDNSLRTKEDWSKEFIRQQPLTDSDPEYICEDIDIFSIEHQEGWGY